jgi:serpin B
MRPSNGRWRSSDPFRRTLEETQLEEGNMDGPRPKSWHRSLLLILGLTLLGPAALAGCEGNVSVSPSGTPTAAPGQALTAAPPTLTPTTAATASFTAPPAATTMPPTLAPNAAGIEYVVADVPRTTGVPGDAEAAAAAINAFGVGLYGQLRRQPEWDGRNLVFSPASVATALAMARAGARGETAAQMDTVLRGVGSDDHAAQISALDQALARNSGTFRDAAGELHQVTLRMTNAPFAQHGMELVPTFVDALAARFGAGLRLVDYRSDADSARLLINHWVKEQTESRIPELLKSGDVDTLTRLVLVNAIYLKAPWRLPFDPKDTKPGLFTLAGGTRVDVPVMYLRSETGGVPYLPYAKGNGWRAVELPYLGDSLALTVIVRDDLAVFETKLTPTLFDQVIRALEGTDVELTFPRFGIETSAGLGDALSAMGMPLAFDPEQADFTGIAMPSSEPPLYISRVIHQANIDVDEKGTEAAAATAVVMATGGGAPEWITFNVDRPFLFALRDTATGAVLFLGRVVDASTRS